MTTRKPAAAGIFYPDDINELRNMIYSFMKTANDSVQPPKVIISPHAGYVYSGAIEASAYKAIEPIADDIKQVVLLGPSHHVGFSGLAVPSVEYFETPLGNIPVNKESINKILKFPYVTESDEPHIKEHSLEVQLPFLQEILGSFQLVPIVTGNAAPQHIADVIKELWGESETLIVISSDLSHFQDYDSAKKHDNKTSNAITNKQFNLTPHDACGCTAVNGLLYLAKETGLDGTVIDVRNSGDTTGDKNRVVGYGAYHFGKIKDSIQQNDLKRALLNLARNSIAYGLENGKPMQEIQFPEELYDETNAASFVTIEKSGKLRGCIGTLEAYRPLAEDIANNAFSAAFQDPRFAKLSREEFPEIDIYISVLSKPESIKFSSEEDLLNQIRPGIDGLILTEGEHSGTFLPSVWESIPVAKDFLYHLKGKAGLSGEYWSNTIEIQRYTADYFG